ncbi:MAG: alpha/beta hydrolase [Fimbriimonadaceae bacterium]|nr:alpha/beta hydrolase [Fimbriimonadaceae bacterium]
MALVSLVAALALTSARAPTVTKNIVYRKVAGVELALDLYRPAGDAKVPVVLVVHGGGWTGGKREEMAPLCEMMANEGLAAATLTYRLSPAFRWPAHFEDCQAAVRFLRANAAKYNLSTEKAGAAGASAGGHLSLLLGMRDTLEKGAENADQSSRVQAVFNIFGPVDVSQDFNKAIADMLSKQVIGKAFSEAVEEAKEFSPITYVSATSAPVFTLHGMVDPLVPVRQADRLTEAYSKVGVECVTFLVPKLGHTIDLKNPSCVQAVKDGVAFLKRHLTSP